MLLAIDVGNTQTVIGLFDDARAGRPLAHRDRRRAHVRRARAACSTSSSAFHGFTLDAAVTGMAISSGVPRVTAALREMTERYFGFDARRARAGVRTGMPILYENPKEVGADRIANAVGAYDLYGGPTIVVDFGTATTVDAVSAPRASTSAAPSSPASRSSMDALFGRAAGAAPGRARGAPNVIGKSTVEAIQSGAVYGFSGAGRRARARFRRSSGTAPWSPPAAWPS